MKNLFDENNQDVSEYEMLAGDTQPSYEPKQPKRQQPPAVDTAQDIVEWSQSVDEEAEIAYDLEEDEQGVVDEAMTRLEQARLYDMLIKHDVFEGVQASPIALHNVRSELKQYIVERLGILLGIRQEKTPTQTQMRVELPFNKLEIQALKDLAFKLTKGATDEVKENQYADATSVEEEAPKPVRQVQKPQGLKSLGQKNLPTKQVIQPTKQVAKQPTQSNVVVNKTKKVKIPELKQKTLTAPNGETITQEEIEEARRQLEQELSASQSKNPYDMSEEELMERSKQIKGPRKSTKVRGLPMPSVEQTNAMYAAKAQNSIGNQDNNMSSILNRVLSQK